MLVFARRGHHAVFPGNTLQAFDAAVRLGVDGIQTDVRLSGDGVAVLFSDDHVRGRPVADLSRRDIARIVGHEVPTLNEALLRFPKSVWNIEIRAPAAIGAVMQTVSAFAATRRMVVTSAHHELVARCAGVAPVPAGLLLTYTPSDLPALLADHAASTWLRTLVWEPRILRPTLLRQAQAARWANYVRGVDDADSMRLLARHGIDALITDRADLVPPELRGATAAGDAATGGPAAGEVPASVGRTAEPEPRMDAATLLRASIESWTKEAGW
jgi:glycerophosphoryl diester phosphodiesterase